jgi:serine/threonine-protein kinase
MLVPREPRDDGADPLVGRFVGARYEILGRLAEGGMGILYVALQKAIEKRVALKVLKEEYAAREDIVARFQQEAVSACRVKHPNVADVFDLGTLDDGRLFLAMELLEGRDLAEELRLRGRIAPRRGLNIALQICRAVHAAHRKGVVHRDLKPENVFLHRTSDGDEIVKIVDFGMSELRPRDELSTPKPALGQGGTVFGTPEYMAPEQATAEPVDHRVDVYAVGVILYEMFAGTVPFSGASVFEVLTAHAHDSVPPLKRVGDEAAISPELEQVIVNALAKQADDRYESMAKFAEALAATPENHDGTPVPLTRAPRARRSFFRRAIESGLRRRRAKRTIAVAALAMCIGVAVGWRAGNVHRPAVEALVLPPSPVLREVSVNEQVAPPPPVATVAMLASATASVRPPASPSPIEAHGGGPTVRAVHRERPAQVHEVAGATSLPDLERCYETVGAERREVACSPR